MVDIVWPRLNRWTRYLLWVLYIGTIIQGIGDQTAEEITTHYLWYARSATFICISWTNPYISWLNPLFIIWIMYSLGRGGAIGLSALEHSPIIRGLLRKLSTLREQNKSKNEHIIILGGGIAGLSTARYLLQLSKFTRITLIDRNVDLNSPDNSKYP